MAVINQGSYRVKRGDTLSTISQKTGTSVTNIIQKNKSVKRVRPGQVLSVPPSGGVGNVVAGPSGVQGRPQGGDTNVARLTGTNNVAPPARYTSAGSRGRVDETVVNAGRPIQYTALGRMANMFDATANRIGQAFQGIDQAFSKDLLAGLRPPPVPSPGGYGGQRVSNMGSTPLTQGPPVPPGYNPNRSQQGQRGPTDMDTYMGNRTYDEQANLNAMINKYRNLQPLIDAGLYQLRPEELRDLQRFGLISRSAAQNYASTGTGGSVAGTGVGGGGGRGGRGGSGGGSIAQRSYGRSLAYTGAIHWRL